MRIVAITLNISEQKSFLCKTNTITGTAFRGFGAPQSTFVIDAVMDHVAEYLKMPPEQVRFKNQ
jgi:xanthine dehydrogenase molybdopterin-binding subunit B